MILYGQSFEDPSIELSALEYFKKISNKKYIDTLLIGNGGCILMTLLTSNFIFGKIDVFDDPEQLFLIQLKMSLFYELSKDDYIKFIEGTMEEKKIIRILNKLQFLNPDAKNFWFNNKDVLLKGINTHNIELPITVHENTMKMYKLLYSSPEDNYFYNQMVNNCYSKKDMPLYLINYDKKQIANIYYINTINSKLYNVISISNIIDYIEKSEFITLLKKLHNILSQNGILVMRRIKSQYTLYNTINETKLFKIINESLIDKTYLFKEIMIVQKIDS